MGNHFLQWHSAIIQCKNDWLWATYSTFMKSFLSSLILCLLTTAPSIHRHYHQHRRLHRWRDRETPTKHHYRSASRCTVLVSWQSPFPHWLYLPADRYHCSCRAFQHCDYEADDFQDYSLLFLHHYLVLPSKTLPEEIGIFLYFYMHPNGIINTSTAPTATNTAVRYLPGIEDQSSLKITFPSLSLPYTEVLDGVPHDLNKTKCEISVLYRLETWFGVC